ncbi:AAA family ATPase [Actinomadura sp. HBU206391]|uniref:AAA family ATPase n=1 Tax=Actinomadura sp. HBU206391 TaxID=2731692 RepID=UPI00164F7A45|nr:AAA family ATPase [Actinomadura sp. HBU206391]MBC6456609.1 AAA family ATPase [Actinomadura sp. HBU206391]
MKFISVELENFRPYQGTQKISFAQDPESNVTVLWGTNGGGKTTLLNAFTWALYSNLSADVEDHDQLINSTVWNKTPEGAPLSASVTIEFEHGSHVYIVKRSVYASKHGSIQPRPKPALQLWRRGRSGNLESVLNPSGHLDQMLPERLSRFFFVNGERIEALVKHDSGDDVRDAVKTLLGLEAMERAVVHLPKVAQKLRRGMKTEDASQRRLDDLLGQLEDAERMLQEQQRRRNAAEKEKKHFNSEIEVLNLKMTQLAEAKELQHNRYRLENQLNRGKAARQQQEEERAKQVGTSGYLAFLPALPGKILAACEELRERGELPAPLKKAFIDDLLERGMCICGTPLAEVSPHRAALERWRARAGLAEVEAAWNQLRGAVESIDERRVEMNDALRGFDARIAEAQEEERRLEHDIDEIGNKLKRLPSEEVVETEEKLEAAKLARDEKVAAIGAAKAEVKRLEGVKDDLKSQIEKLDVKDARSRRIRSRIMAVEEASTALAQILEILSQGVRRRLDARIQELYRLVSLKNFEPELTPDFELKLWDPSGTERVPALKSTGENMLLSLAFVGSLIGEARQAQERGRTFVQGIGGDFPVVMDAVFGNLDDDYRKAVADFLPRLASQVVMLTSKAQAGDIVEQELRSRLGKQYVITAHTTKIDVSNATGTLTLNGNTYPYQVVGSDRTGAELTEVRS